MKITLDLTDAQTLALLRCCERLSTSAAGQDEGFSELQSAAGAIGEQLVRQLDGEILARVRPGYLRSSQNDRRITSGDDFAGDAWREISSGEIVYTAVGARPL